MNRKKPLSEDLKFAGEHIRYAFRHWHETGITSTLGGLLNTLRVAEEDMARFDRHALIADHWEDLRVALSYVELFGDPNLHDDDLPLTFEYMLANIKEDIDLVEQLIEGLGESFKFADLPKSKAT